MLVNIRKVIANHKGFTLVELMIVIAILGVLAAIAVPKLSGSADTARGAKVQADLRTIDTAISMAISAGTYTAGSMSGTGAIPASVSAYLSTVPTPPTGAIKVGTHNYTMATSYSIDANDRAVVVGGSAAGLTSDTL